MAHHKAPENNFEIVKFLDDEIKRFLSRIDDDKGFWVGDFNRVRQSLNLWNRYLSKVKPFYAIKCCDEPTLLRFLVNKGLGFDCASKDEIERMINFGARPEKIVFSHPLKSAESIKYAKAHNVKKLVYDTENELRKILKYYPNAEVYLRVKPKFTKATIQLSNKFGVAPDDVVDLLKVTKELLNGTEAKFIGIAFHVGSLCDDLETFKVALEDASKLKAEAEKLELNVSFIDIGGGFLPPNEKTKFNFEEIAQAINDSINEYFPNDDINFIAEPGRFIGSEFMDLYLPVIGTREHKNEDGSKSYSIFIPDGMYGSFNALTYDHAVPIFEMYSSEDIDENNLISTTLWGQTCDSADCIYENMMWPKLQIGDILKIQRFSAYTYSPSSFFNGFHHHDVFFLNEEEESKDDDAESI